MLQQVKHHRQRLGVGDVIGEIRRKPFKVLGDAHLTDAFGNRSALHRQLTRGVIVVQAPHRQDRPARFSRPWVAAPYRACQRPTRPNRTHKAIDFAISLFPNFRACGLDMRLTVGDVVKLVGPDHALVGGAAKLCGQTFGIANKVVGVPVRSRGHLYKFGPSKAQHLLFLFLIASRGSRSRI